MATRHATPNFQGLRVLALESRRANEVASLITTYGGEPLVAPALREVPLESNPEALRFAAALVDGTIDIVIFLTGVGVRALLRAVENAYPLPTLTAALARTRIVARGPKPLAVLRELQLPIWIVVPEPNTWRELLAAVDAEAEERPLPGARVAVQEYGVSNIELIDQLRQRGAEVMQVPVYRWALPEDLEPLKKAAAAIAGGQLQVALFTTGVQVVHLRQIAEAMGLEADIRRGLSRMVIVSIGPTTSEELHRYGLTPDLEASRPKMGFLVKEAAEQSAALLRAKQTP